MLAWWNIIEPILFQNTVSSPQDCSKRCTLYDPWDLFKRTSSRRLCEAFGFAVIDAERLNYICTHNYPPLFIEMSEMEQRIWSKVRHDKGSSRARVLPIEADVLSTMLPLSAENTCSSINGKRWKLREWTLEWTLKRTFTQTTAEENTERNGLNYNAANKKKNYTGAGHTLVTRSKKPSIQR